MIYAGWVNDVPDIERAHWPEVNLAHVVFKDRLFVIKYEQKYCVSAIVTTVLSIHEEMSSHLLSVNLQEK